MDLIKRSFEEVKHGFHKSENSYICNYCEQVFEEGQVYPLSDKFYTAEQMILNHIESVHGGNFQMLVDDPSKYNTLTKKQKELLRAFTSKKKDAEIASELGVSASTIRHQKFTFREKAKQAKLYLALYENVFRVTEDPAERFLPIPTRAANVDDRFAITEKEYTDTIQAYFDFTDGLVLKRLPRKQKRIIAVLNRIKAEIDGEKTYTEKEITALLQTIYYDPVTLRRYLYDYGYISRTKDGTKYWLEKS